MTYHRKPITKLIEDDIIRPKYQVGEKVRPSDSKCVWTHAIVKECRVTSDEDWQYLAVAYYPDGERMGAIFFESEFVSAQGIKRAIERINEK